METININAGSTWTRLVTTANSITVESVEQEGIELVVTRDITIPNINLRGHLLKVGMPMSVSKIDSGAVWVRSSLDSAVVVFTT